MIDFLSTSLIDGTIASEDAESVEIAQSCIADAFHVSASDKSALQEALGGQSLLSIFSVYEKLRAKPNAGAGASTNSSAAQGAFEGTSKSRPGAGTVTSPEAEAFKSQGNSAMAGKDFKSAIELYSKAVAISPTNPIYLSNRAAAYSASNQHAEACADAEMAVAADPKYTKAWSRLGLAKFALGDAKGSMEAYKNGIEHEGNGGSEAMKKGFETAKRRVEEEGQSANDSIDQPANVDRGAGSAGGMPDLSALAGMFGGRGGGGGPDLSSIMSNPMFASMAQNLMSNPDMMNNLMSNPNLRQMAENFGGAGGGEGRGGVGGMPDIGSLMQDPSIAEMHVITP